MAAGAPETDRVELRDGGAVLIAPIHPDDRRRFVAGMSKTSPRSLYLRFMTPIQRLTESQLRYLLAVDHRDHEALLAVDEESGEAIGVARFVRLDERPDVAEAAVLVIDDWHGRGVGKAILRLLGERAKRLGIRAFEATMLVENRPMMALLEALGPVRTVDRYASTLTVEVDLRP